jgi:hypothetical protein
MTYLESTVSVASLTGPRNATGVGTTSGSATVTDTSAVASDLSKSVSGPGIPAGATITAVTPGTGYTISANATATASVATTVGGSRVRAVASRTGFVRVYDPSLLGLVPPSPLAGGSPSTAWSAAITAAPYSLLSNNLPAVFAVATNSVAGDVSGANDYNDAAPWYSDPTAATPIVGTYRLHLVPVTGSPDASSVQVLTVESSALVVVGTG